MQEHCPESGVEAVILLEVVEELDEPHHEMVTCRYRQEVLSKETVPLGESTSLRLHSQPKEPQVTRDPLRRPILLERQECP